MSLATMLESVCTIQKPNISQDTAPQGGTLQTFATVSTGVPCSIQAPTLRALQIYGQENAESLVSIFFLNNPNVQKNWKILGFSQKGTATGTFLVVGEDQAVYIRYQSPWYVHCLRIK